jgi:hypothetical protein
VQCLLLYSGVSWRAVCETLSPSSLFSVIATMSGLLLEKRLRYSLRSSMFLVSDLMLVW